MQFNNHINNNYLIFFKAWQPDSYLENEVVALKKFE